MPLDPDLESFLERQRSQPPRSALSINETRDMMLRNVALSEKSPPLPRIGEHRLPSGTRAREYWPAVDSTLPLTIYFHGGRFFSGSIETHDSLCRFLALFSGSRILSVDYRLAPEHPFPAAVEDARSAVAWARERAPSLAVAGDSAGACLAALAAIGCREARAQLLLYPMLDPACSMSSHREFASGYGPGSEDMLRGWQIYLGDRRNAIDACVTPLAAADLGGAPSAFVLTAEYDCLRDEGEEYARRLADAGVEVLVRRYEGTIHGFAGMTAFSRAARCAIVEAGEFLHARFSAGEHRRG